MDSIVIQGLTKTYKDVTAVNHLDLSIRDGELFSLLGVNGAGKTTTIKMLSCLTSPTGGDALLKGKSIKNDPQAVKSIIAVSPQETAVAPNLTVKENLGLMAGAHGFSRETAKKKEAELMDQFDLREISGKKAKKLSGGWQRSDLWDVIRSLKGKVTIILTTHYMEEAEALSDRIAILKNGSLLIAGTAGEIKDRAGTEKFEDAFVKLVKEGK